MRLYEVFGGRDLFYFDESGLSLNSNLPYAWRANGQEIEVPKHAYAKRLNVLGFLSCQNQLHAYFRQGRADTEVVIEVFEKFLSTSERTQNKPVFVVLDNARIHTSNTFQAAAKRWREGGIYWIYLPTYSPELNLIKILWKHVKHHWLDFSAYNSFEDLCKQVKEVTEEYGRKYVITFA